MIMDMYNARSSPADDGIMNMIMLASLPPIAVPYCISSILRISLTSAHFKQLGQLMSLWAIWSQFP